MNIASPDIVRWQGLRGYLETLRHGSSRLYAHKKNSMRQLRDSASELLRQENAAHTGSFMWRCQDIFGIGSAAGQMQEVQESEAGGDEVDSEQSFLHKAIWYLCRQEVPHNDNQGCGQGIEAGLAYCKVIGEGIHAGTASAESCSSPWSDRDRRNINAEGAHLSNRSKRFGEGTTHLVWGEGPFRGES